MRVISTAIFSSFHAPSMIFGQTSSCQRQLRENTEKKKKETIKYSLDLSNLCGCVTQECFQLGCMSKSGTYLLSLLSELVVDTPGLIKFISVNGTVFTSGCSSSCTWSLNAQQLPNSFYREVKAGNRNLEERLIPKKGLFFFIL